MWQILVSRYMSDFFVSWYTPYGLVIYGFCFFLLPITKIIAYIADLFYQKDSSIFKVYKPLRICMIVFSGAKQHKRKTQRSNWIYWLTFFFGLVFLYYHYHFQSTPNFVVENEKSLQSLSYEDVSIVIGFFYRWIGFGWSLILVTFVMILSFLGPGWKKLRDISQRVKIRFDLKTDDELKPYGPYDYQKSVLAIVPWTVDDQPPFLNAMLLFEFLKDRKQWSYRKGSPFESYDLKIWVENEELPEQVSYILSSDRTIVFRMQWNDRNTGQKKQLVTASFVA